jgi:hypothetical protein
VVGLKTLVACALLLILLLTPVAGADAGGVLSIWEISVDFVPPQQEHLQIFVDVKNTGTEGISGLELALAADSAEYIESEALTFDDEEDSKKMEVVTGQDNGKSVITVTFPRTLEPGQSEQAFLDFNTKGLLNKEGDEYTTTIQFEEPMMILENGDKVSLDVDTGSFRVHTPEGFVYTKFNPVPWREIWQGVSGFNAHFILIFNGGTSITTSISASFKESAQIKRAVELYKTIKEQEAAKTRPQEDLEEANRRITDGANYMIFGTEAQAKIELDKAESILTGKSIEEVISKNIEPVDVEDTPETEDIKYIIGAAVALFLIIVIFGRKIILVLTGGKKDDK